MTQGEVLTSMVSTKHELPTISNSMGEQNISDMKDQNIVQPSLVTLSALTLATECIRMILKIDDIVMTR